MHKNTLTVVGITILFLGLAIQPSIAVNPISSDNEEDCNLYPKVSNLQVIEKYKELSDGITTLKKINKGYVSDLSWDFPIICGFLKIITILFENISKALLIIGFGWALAIFLVIFGIYLLYSFIQIFIQNLLNR